MQYYAMLRYFLLLAVLQALLMVVLLSVLLAVFAKPWCGRWGVPSRAQL